MPDEKTPTPTPTEEPIQHDFPEPSVPAPEPLEKRWDIGEAEVSDEYATIDRHPVPEKPEQQE